METLEVYTLGSGFTLERIFNVIKMIIGSGSFRSILSSAAFNVSAYQRTGLIFGTKIVEDMGKLNAVDKNLEAGFLYYTRECLYPDISLGYKRKNGFTMQDFAKEQIESTRELQSSSNIEAEGNIGQNELEAGSSIENNINQNNEVI